MRTGVAAAAVILGFLLAGCGSLEATPASPTVGSSPDPFASPSAHAVSASEVQWCFDTFEPPPCVAHAGVNLMGSLALDHLEARFSFGFPSVHGPSSEQDLLDQRLALVARVFGADGVLVSEQPLALAMDSSGEAGGFEIFMPGVDGRSRVEIVYEDTVVGAIDAGPHAPTVTNINYDASEFGLDISWSGADADGDSLEYTVLMVDPDGQRQVVALGTDQTSISAGTQEWPLAGGDGQRIVVVASDGLNVGWDVSGPVDLPDTPPQVFLDFEQTSFTTSRLHAIVLGASAFDQEDQASAGAQEALAAAITWTSDIDGVLARGPEFYLNGAVMLDGPEISVGVHTVTVSVTDSGGNTAEESFTLAVE